MVTKRALAGGVVGVALGAWLSSRRPASVRRQRNVDVAKLGSRVGADWAAHRARRVFASAERREQLDTEFELRSAEQVVAALGNMKGALMKLGQMASYVDESVPAPIREALAQLQQDAPPMSAELAAQVIEEELRRQPDKIFAEWDPVPIAAASIGQVHRAITHDDVAVAVKVQYPGVDEAIRADLDNSAALTNFASMAFPGFDAEPFIAELRSRLLEELDYRREAENQQLFVDFYEGHPFIAIPRVVPELSASRVLTTELAAGARFAELDNWSQDERDLAGEAIFRFVFRGLYHMHAFNGDPHPGNYLFSPGGRVTFLDFGLVKRFDPTEITMFERMAKALVIERDIPTYKAVLEESGVLKPGLPMSDDRIVDYFGYFYEPVLDDGEWTFTTDYASQALARLMPMPGGEFPEIRSFGNLPPAFVLIQRINLGMSAVLAHLHAAGNWRAIAEEIWPFVDGPPSTELGRQEAAWRATR
ncbi:MAG: AarF/ABC1/UbiB kinase family protein [Actinobacteria bacterium]|nr:AarF/ABC1/UbiB kinase family protein [Actinomycetota bacterium]